MPADRRMQAMVDHLEAVLAILTEIEQEVRALADQLRSEQSTDRHIVAFLEDQALRAQALSELVEEEVIAGLIGLNNLGGAIQHMLPEALQASGQSEGTPVDEKTGDQEAGFGSIL